MGTGTDVSTGDLILALKMNQKLETIDGSTDTISNLNTTHLASGILDTDLTTASSSDDTLASAKAIKTELDKKLESSDLTNYFLKTSDDMDDITDGTTYVKTQNDFTDDLLSKLNGIEESANNYTLPTATADTLGGIKVGTRLSISDSVLSADSQTDNNFTTALKNKLDGIEEGAQVNTVFFVENKTGANCTGSSGEANRTLTLAQTPSVVSHIVVSGAFLHLTNDYTIDGGTITFLSQIWDDMPINIAYTY